MKKKRVMAAEEIGMFCRLQMHMKKDLPIRSSEMGVLIYVQKQPEAVTPLLISKFFQIAKPSVTGMINELVRKNYLMKVPSETDKRSYTVAITDKGKALVESTQDEYFKSIEVLREKMGEADFEQFLRLMEQANDILKGEKNQ